MRAQVHADRRRDDEPEDSKTRRRRLYKVLSEERPMFPVQQRNFHTLVMENKEIIKVLSMLSSCTQELRQNLMDFLDQWKPYKYLWKNERSMRELLSVSLSNFENTLRKHSELEDKLSSEYDMSYLGTSIALDTEKLKYGLSMEIKSELIYLGINFINRSFNSFVLCRFDI